MPADYSRIHRLLKILTLIQGGDGWTSKRLAQECQTAERTIYRDLKMLDAAGIPYYFDPERKSYHVRRDFFMPPVPLTLEESLALAALAEHAGGREQVPFTKAASKAIAKIRGQLPSAIRSELERLEAHVSIQLAAANPPEAAADVYARVQGALARRRTLRCEYESIRASTSQGANHDGAAGKGGEFLFEPYALFFGTRAWYVIGMHRSRGEVRCLKLNRFTRVTETEAAYEIPRSFSLEKHLGNAWRMIRGKERYKVELTFDPHFAETLADTQWHKTQQVEWQDDGSIRFRCTVDGLDEIVWWIMGMGPHCVVHKPPELARLVRDLAAKMVENYAERPAPTAIRSSASRGRISRRTT